jgi:hypothetical protein
MDRLRNGYNLETYFVEGPLRELPIEMYNDYRECVIEYYKENIRGNPDFASKNPRVVAGSLLFKMSYTRSTPYSMVYYLSKKDVAEALGFSETSIKKYLLGLLKNPASRYPLENYIAYWEKHQRRFIYSEPPIEHHVYI